MKRFLVIVQTSDKRIERHPMRSWLRSHPEHLPAGMDVTSRTNSHQLRTALKRAGWCHAVSDSEETLAMPGIPSQAASSVVINPSSAGPSASVRHLCDIGFVRVGGWSLNGSRITCDIHGAPAAVNVLYAFVSGDEVLYIGKSRKPIKQRMAGYERPGRTQATNRRVKPLIAELLHLGKPVDIYAFSDSSLLHYGGCRVNLAAGLEDGLLQTIKPRWNVVGI